jgi:hypothetical protein
MHTNICMSCIKNFAKGLQLIDCVFRDTKNVLLSMCKWMVKRKSMLKQTIVDVRAQSCNPHKTYFNSRYIYTIEKSCLKWRKKRESSLEINA